MCPVCTENGALVVRTGDYTRRQAKADFQRARRAERRYGAQLRQIAKIIGQFVRSMDPSTLEGVAMIRSALETYANTLKPWASSVAKAMIADVAARDRKEWRKLSNEIGSELQRKIDNTPMGSEVQALMDAQVHLITSMPRDAALRVHELAMKAQTDGSRAKALVAEIMRTGEVTRSRAELIARTEVGRASTVMTQVRATAIGSTGYIWRTVGDSDVRPSHRKMNGKFVRWDRPPTLDKLTGHAGALPNCRCYCEPVIPDPDY